MCGAEQKALGRLTVESGGTGVKIRGEGVVTLSLSPASVFFYHVYFIHSTRDDIKLILILTYFTWSISVLTIMRNKLQI